MLKILAWERAGVAMQLVAVCKESAVRKMPLPLGTRVEGRMQIKIKIAMLLQF